MSVLRSTYKLFSYRFHQSLKAISINNPIVIAFVAAIGIIAAIGLSTLPLKMVLLGFGGILALPILYLCFTNLLFGLTATLLTASMVSFVGKFVSIPIGMALDGFLFIMSFSLVVNQTKERDWSFAKNPISYAILLWIFYNFIQVLNPDAGSQLAWVYTVRTLALYNFIFFVASYAIKNLNHAKIMVKVLLGMAIISCLYGLKQEFIGFSNAEIAWLYADDKRFQLIVQWGRFRVFSFFSDPTTFGVLMAYMGTFCLVLAFGAFKIWQRVVLAISAAGMFAAMVYAGSRTPFVLVPAGLLFYTVVNMRKEIIVGAGIFLVLGTGAMMKSTSNPVIFRLQSAFKPSEDASVQVRMDNQKMVQPFLQTHPVGAGLGTTGMWGARFTPDSWLASFAHDSGYVRIAAEAGWIGLLIYMGLLFTILRTALFYYFRCYNPQIKTLYLGFSVVIFMLGLASYPQEVIPLPPTSIIFYILLGLIVKLKDFDTRPETEYT